MRSRLIGRLGVAVAGALAAAAALAVGFSGAPPAGASASLNGGGSGFAALEIQQWQGDVASPAYGSLSVNYSSQSSGIGRQYFASNTWDFGASDIRYIPGVETALLNQAQSGRCGGRAQGQCFKYVPVSAGGLGFMYNLSNPDGSRFGGLKLTPVDVCRIFTGELTTWGSPELVANNPSLRGSTQAIAPVVRQDEAGESYVLSQYCIAEDPADWNSFVHFQATNLCTTNTDYYSFDVGAFQSGNPVPIWPSVLFGCRGAVIAGGSDGVANIVVDPSQGPGSITYNAAGYALVRNFPNASVENAAGRFTQPAALSVTIALEYARAVGDGTFSLDFRESSGADPRAYNPSTYSYILAQTGGFSLSKGTTLGRFLCYDIGIGQKDAAPLLFAPLSKQVQRISQDAAVQIPGAPPPGTAQGQCLAGAPAASNPPPLQTVTPVTTASGASGATSGSSGGTGGAGGSGSSASSSSGGSKTAGSASSRAAAAAAATAARARAAAGTTAAGTSAANAGGASSGTALTQGTQGSGTSGGIAAATTPTNYDALWSILEGAAVCALVVAFVGARRRAET
jgi:phosphate transport system substrate-binding protein